jgi:hypothetical protein
LGFPSGHHIVGLDRLHRVASDDDYNRRVVLYLWESEVATSIYVFRVENTAGVGEVFWLSMKMSDPCLPNDVELISTSTKHDIIPGGLGR